MTQHEIKRAFNVRDQRAVSGIIVRCIPADERAELIRLHNETGVRRREDRRAQVRLLAS